MYNAIEKQQLLSLAHDAIQHGLTLGTRMEVVMDQYPSSLKEIKATFVTLKIEGLLRGCIGNIFPRESLVESVAYNAYSAAFNDPRFSSLRADELPLLHTEISILSELEAMEFHSEEDLLTQLQPGQDGLVLSAGDNSATFLPSVWEQLPEPRTFLAHLKEKAGLGADAWPEGISAERYTVFCITH